MNSTIELLKEHKSIRNFKEKDIPDEVLNTILECASRASSSGNMQSYSIIVTKDQAMKEKMYKAHFEQPMYLKAPVFLTFCCDFNRMRTWVRASRAKDNFDNFMSFMIGSIDATLASQNAAIAAESLGLGLCYMGTTLASCQKIGEALELPENVLPIVGFALGYPDEEIKKRYRFPLESIVHKETYLAEDPESVTETYAVKEEEGMRRYKSHPQLKKMIDESGVSNLAQVYTHLKYTRESHQKYSSDLLNYLERQGFMNNG